MPRHAHQITGHANKQEADAHKTMKAWVFCRIINNREIKTWEELVSTWLGDEGILKKYQEEEKIQAEKLPYHINLIDLLRPKADEPTHSRIFGNLLKQNKNGFQILGAFVEYLKNYPGGDGFHNLSFEKPEITIEKEHIDIWIRDKKTNKALIFENKIHDAQDQNKQLSRYIDKTRETGFTLDDIYVIYMPNDAGKDPEGQSWGVYKEEFKNRYLQISFRDLLRWFKTSKALVIPDNETFLRSTLEQYIDYLEGENMFRSHQRFSTMNNKLTQLIRNELGLDKLPINEQLKIISEKKEDLQRIIENLKKIEMEINIPIFLQEWKARIEKQYSNYKPSIKKKKDRNGEHSYLDVPFLQGTNTAFNASIAAIGEAFYYGITADNLENRSAVIKCLHSLRLESKHGYKNSTDPGELLCYYKEAGYNDTDKQEKCFQSIINLIRTIDNFLGKTN